MTFAGSNWIAGRRVEAVSGARFELTRGERWPRSDERDVRVARAFAADHAASWRARGLLERRELLARAFEELAFDRDGCARAARQLALAPEALQDECERAADAAATVLRSVPLDLARSRLSSGEGACALRFEWNELVVEPARELAAALSAGRSVLLVADGRAPALADLFARALADLPAGVFACLVDDGLTAWRAACEEPAFELVRGATHDDDDASELVRAGARAFARPLRSRSLVVRVDDDLEDLVPRIARLAFGREDALCGVRPGAIGRVLLPHRVFSRASELVLDAVAALPHAREPLPLARSTCAAELERALALANDEGATIVASTWAARAFPFPVVVTNVHAAMQTARATRPLPLLRLLRTRDEREALRLGARLDREGG